MEETVQPTFNIASFLSIVPTEVAKSNRASLLKQLYALYISQPEINKAENRKRYRYWMGKNHKDLVKKDGFDPVKYASFKDAFKKAKLPKEEKFISYIREDRFWYFFSHCDIDGLQKLISESRDILHRYEMANMDEKEKYIVSRHIFGSVKYNEK